MKAKSLENICARGDLELLKKLYSEGKISKHNVVRVDKNNLTLFESAGKHGQLKICKWLYYTFQITKKDAMFNDNFLFTTTCSYNHLEISKWLQKKFQFTKEEITVKTIFCAACQCGFLEICEWLYFTFQLTKKEIEDCNNSALKRACHNKHYNIISFLCNTCGFTIEDTNGFLHWFYPENQKKILQMFDTNWILY
jgi:hypothetical protein